MAEVGSIFVGLTADVARFSSDMDRGARGVEDFGRRSQGALRNVDVVIARTMSDLRGRAEGLTGQLGVVGSALRAMGPAGLLAGAGVGALIIGISKGIQMAHHFGAEMLKLRNAAQVLGVTGLELQAIQDAGAKFGLTEEAIGSGLQRFTAQMEEFRRGSGTLFELIQKIDPALAREMAAANDTARELDLLGKAYERAGASRQAALSRAAFGKTGFDIGLLIQDIARSGGIQKLTEEFRKSGDAIDDAMIKRVAQLKAEIDDLAGDSRRNVAALFAVPILEGIKSYYEQFVGLSRAAREFTISDALKAMLGVTGATVGLVLPAVAVVSKGAGLLASQFPSESERLDQLRVAHAKVTAEMERWQKLAETEPNPNVAGRAAIVAENWARQLATVNAELDAINRKKPEKPPALVATSVPSVGKPGGVASPQTLPPAAKPSFELEANVMRNWIALLGEAAIPSEQLRLKKLELAAAAEKYSISQEFVNRGLAAFIVAQQKAAVAARTGVGVASEAEMQTVALAQVKELEAKGYIKGEEEKAAATRMLMQQIREAYEQMLVARSQTPNLTRLSLESNDLRLQLDQGLGSSLRSITSDLIEMAKGTVTASQGLKNMVLKMADAVAQAVLMKTVIGPLASGIASLFPGAAGGGGVAGSPLDLLAYTRHVGGRMDGSGSRRRVSAMAFMGAPKFHKGLYSGEFPTVLQRGERVLTAAMDDRATRTIAGLTSAASAMGPGVQIHVHPAQGTRTDVRRSQSSNGERIDITQSILDVVEHSIIEPSGRLRQGIARSFNLNKASGLA